MSEITPEPLKTLKLDALRKINMGKKYIHSFNVDFSSIDETLVGKITMHYPTQLEKMNIGVKKTMLLGGVEPLDIMTDNLAHMTATLDTIIESKPEWLAVDNPDVSYDMLESIFMEYQTWVNSFRKPTEPTGDKGNS